jgi:hypothetical protein
MTNFFDGVHIIIVSEVMLYHLIDYDTLPTPWRIQMWIQIEDNGRVRN